MVVAVRRIFAIWQRSRAGIFGREKYSKMIPIKNLVRDGGWMKCMARNRWTKDTTEWTFRMRILSFELFDCSQVDKPERLKPIEVGAVRWLMKLEVVNLSKVSILFGYLTQEMRLVDGFQFEEDSSDAGLTFSDFARRIGLSLGSLSPKIKAQGAVIFKLPDEDMEYLLTIKDGTIEET
jgi:hypothetical protein